MQEVQYSDGRIEREFFMGRRERDLHDAMDARLKEQQAEGATLVKRTGSAATPAARADRGASSRSAALTGRSWSAYDGDPTRGPHGQECGGAVPLSYHRRPPGHRP